MSDKNPNPVDRGLATEASVFSSPEASGVGGAGTRKEDDWDVEPGTGLPLDAGIKPYVNALRSAGIETFESCEGGAGHAFPEPTIRLHGGVGEGFRAFGIARLLGLPVFQVRLSYTVQDGILIGPHWEMVFIRKATD